MSRSYQDFEPDYQYRKEAHDIIEFQVKDFKKDHLKVRQKNGVITVSGERNLDGTTWIRFRKEFNTPKECKANEIRARLSSGILYITIPSEVTPQVPQQDPITPVQQASSPIQYKEKLEQEISSQSKEAADTFTAKHSGARDVMASPNENATLPKARPQSFISRLKMERKTAMKVVASVTVLALLFTTLFYVFKFYAPMTMHVSTVSFIC
ncbi:hypothetical protein CRYUN_Cryun09bG0210900 [Craigia yunnanensis]